MLIISDAMRAFFNTKQKDNKSLQDFTRRLNTSKEITESHIGTPLLILKYIKTLPEYKNSMKLHEGDKDNTSAPNVYDKKWTKFAAIKIYAYIYLENLDQSKYGSVLKL